MDKDDEVQHIHKCNHPNHNYCGHKRNGYCLNSFRCKDWSKEAYNLIPEEVIANAQAQGAMVEEA